VSAASSPSPVTLTVNMLQRCQASSGPAPAGSIQKRSPNTLTPRTRLMLPYGIASGIRNQSLA
jgi:hypothetical protein